MAEYHRWSRAVWSTLRTQLQHSYVMFCYSGVFECRLTRASDNNEAQKILDSLEPSRELSGQFGIGGNIREVGHVSEKPDRPGLVFAQRQVHDQLRKGRKLLVRSSSLDLINSEQH